MPSRKSISNPIRAFRSISAHPWQNTESKGPGVKGHTLSYRNDAISQQEAAELTCHLSIYIESPGLHWDSLWSLMGTDEGQEAALCHKAVMMMMMVVKSTPPGMQREWGISYAALQTSVVIKRWSWAQPQWELHHLTEEEELKMRRWDKHKDSKSSLLTLKVARLQIHSFDQNIDCI